MIRIEPEYNDTVGSLYRGISIRQPFVYAIIHKLKQWENRTHKRAVPLKGIQLPSVNTITLKCRICWNKSNDQRCYCNNFKLVNEHKNDSDDANINSDDVSEHKNDSDDANTLQSQYQTVCQLIDQNNLLGLTQLPSFIKNWTPYESHIQQQYNNQKKSNALHFQLIKDILTHLISTNVESIPLWLQSVSIFKQFFQSIDFENDNVKKSLNEIEFVTMKPTQHSLSNDVVRKTRNKILKRDISWFECDLDDADPEPQHYVLFIQSSDEYMPAWEKYLWSNIDMSLEYVCLLCFCVFLCSQYLYFDMYLIIEM